MMTIYEAFDILGLSHDASSERITKAYRSLSMKWHPDGNPSGIRPEAETLQRKLNAAYEILLSRVSPSTGQVWPSAGMHRNDDPVYGNETGAFLVLYDHERYVADANLKQLLIGFVVENFFVLVPRIKEGLTRMEFFLNKLQPGLYAQLLSSKGLYEYPRALYHRNSIPKGYDQDIAEKGGTYIWSPPPIDNGFLEKVISSLTHEVLGNVLIKYNDSSIGYVIGIKTRHL